MDWPPGVKIMSYFLHYKVVLSFCFPKSPMKTGLHCANCCIEASPQKHSPSSKQVILLITQYQIWAELAAQRWTLGVTHTTLMRLDDSTVAFGKELTIKYIKWHLDFNERNGLWMSEILEGPCHYVGLSCYLMFWVFKDKNFMTAIFYCRQKPWKGWKEEWKTTQKLKHKKSRKSEKTSHANILFTLALEDAVLQISLLLWSRQQTHSIF